jgi:hypothetical protein
MGKSAKGGGKFLACNKKKLVDRSNKGYWQEKLAHGFNLDYSYFTGKDVLEVG